jgi:hypothetical protein
MGIGRDWGGRRNLWVNYGEIVNNGQGEIAGKPIISP